MMGAELPGHRCMIYFNKKCMNSGQRESVPGRVPDPSVVARAVTGPARHPSLVVFHSAQLRFDPVSTVFHLRVCCIFISTCIGPNRLCFRSVGLNHSRSLPTHSHPAEHVGFMGEPGKNDWSEGSARTLEVGKAVAQGESFGTG